MNHLKSLAYKIPYDNNENNDKSNNIIDKYRDKLIIFWEILIFASTYFTCFFSPILIGIIQDASLSNPIAIILILLDAIFLIDLSMVRVKR
jgi:hypothetical protein